MTDNLIPLSEFIPRAWNNEIIFHKIHYACGLSPLENWLNVDFFTDALIWNFTHMGGVPRHIAENVYKINLLEHHPFPDNTFSYAFCEDFLEHLEQKDAILFIEEVYRTLKPGGVFRFSTPGFGQVLHNHFRNADFEDVLDNQKSAYTQWGHIHFFTHDSMKRLAKALGFRKYKVRGYHFSWHKQLRELESRVEQKNQHINIYGELTK